MSLTAAEEIRIEAIENALNGALTSITNLISKEQMRQLLLLKQRELDAAVTRITSLEAQIVILQSRLG
jgi:hypothetical protein